MSALPNSVARRIISFIPPHPAAMAIEDHYSQCGFRGCRGVGEEVDESGDYMFCLHDHEECGFLGPCLWSGWLRPGWPRGVSMWQPRHISRPPRAEREPEPSWPGRPAGARSLPASIWVQRGE